MKTRVILLSYIFAFSFAGTFNPLNAPDGYRLPFSPSKGFTIFKEFMHGNITLEGIQNFAAGTGAICSMPHQAVSANHQGTARVATGTTTGGDASCYISSNGWDFATGS